MLINEITTKNKKKTKNLIAWFMERDSHTPPLEEYCAKILIIPNNKTEKKRIKSILNNLSLIANGVCKEFLLYNIRCFHQV